MIWHKSFHAQVQECHKTGNRFVLKTSQWVPDKIWTGYDIIVCVPYKSYCCSKNCFERRKKEGKE